MSKSNNNEKFNMKKYLTYNQLIKDDDIITLSKYEYDKLPKEIKDEIRFVMSLKKNLIDTNNEPPQWFKTWVEANKQEMDKRFKNLQTQIVCVRTELKQEIDGVRTELKQDISDVRIEINNLSKRIDHIVEVNNLKE